MAKKLLTKMIEDGEGLSFPEIQGTQQDPNAPANDGNVLNFDSSQKKNNKKLVSEYSTTSRYITWSMNNQIVEVPLIYVRETDKAYQVQWQVATKSRMTYIPKSAVKRVQKDTYKQVKFMHNGSKVSLERYSAFFIYSWFIDKTNELDENNKDQYQFFSEWTPYINATMELYNKYVTIANLKNALHNIDSKLADIVTIKNIELINKNSYKLRTVTNEILVQRQNNGDSVIEIESSFMITMNQHDVLVEINGFDMSKYAKLILLHLCLRATQASEAIRNLTTLLKLHDWYYDMANSNTYRAGKESADMIEAYKIMFKFLNLSDKFTELYNEHKQVMRV